MGDIGTHADITEFVTGEVSASIPPAQVPLADYTYLELGNFLTDVSQFRDPVAFHSARGKAYQRLPLPAQALYGPEWVRDIFGQRSGPVHGALPEFLRMLVHAFTHELFDDDGLPLFGAVLGLLPGGVRPAVIPAHGVPPGRVDAILAGHFTQYFPHEHLDFPPEADLPNHRTKPGFVTGPRGLVGYLERFLQCISEELTKLEQDWVGARATLTASARQQFLVRLGHLLHPVEDYFFHSNLLELYQWAEVRGRHPMAVPTVPADLRTLVDDGLAGSGLNPTTDLRRRLHRRLRYPVYDTQTQLSATGSDDGTALVFTGGFGPTDVWHTLGGALEAMESKIALLPPRLDPRTTELVLIRLLLSASARREMVAGDQASALWQRHREQLLKGEYHAGIGSWHASGLLCRHAAAELTRAFDHDRTVTKLHSGTVFDFPGPGSVLILMLEQMQKERDGAAAAAVGLNSAPASMYGQASTNGCSSENVGTHSLMSKDSDDKQPLRPEAVAFAKHASASVAKLLLDRVYGPAPVTEGVDWDTVLQFFVRGVPAGLGGGSWEREMLQRVHAPGTFRQPSVRVIGQQPPFGLLGPTRDRARLAARRAGTRRVDLETDYRRVESDP